MTRDDITKMAREAGWTIGPATLNGLERFAALVAAAEREACARTIEAEAHMFYTQAACKSLADGIRERGVK